MLYRILLLMLFCLSLSGEDYYAFISRAETEYRGKSYSEASELYKKAFDGNGSAGFRNDKYNAACCSSLNGNFDECYRLLSEIIDGANIIKAWNDPVEFYEMLIKDRDLDNFRKDSRWNQVKSRAEKLKDTFIKGLNRELLTRLNKLRDDDQKFRSRIYSVRKKHGVLSAEYKELIRNMDENDEILFNEFEKIVEQYGWPGPETVGYKGNQALFLVLQHADLKRQERYLPVLMRAVKEGRALPKDLAYLEDRIAVRKNKKQIYGSQIYYCKSSGKYLVRPLIRPEEVDKRRLKSGMASMKKYLADSFKTEWSVSTYRNDLEDYRKCAGKEN